MEQNHRPNISADIIDSLRVIGPTDYVAGETVTLELAYEVKQSQFRQGGHLWLLTDIRQIPHHFQISDPSQAGFVSARASNGQDLVVTCPGEKRPGHLMRTLDLLPSIPEFLHVIEVTLSETLSPGDFIHFQIGDGSGWQIPLHSIDEFNFWIIPDRVGQWHLEMIDGIYHSFSSRIDGLELDDTVRTYISIHSAKPSRLDAVVPSGHTSDSPFSIKISSFDAFDNPCRMTQVEVDYSQNTSLKAQQEDIEIVVAKHAAPEIIRFDVTDRSSGLSVRTNPSKAETESVSEHVYWGILHGMFFNQRPIDYYYNFAREARGLDFCAGQHFSYEAALPGVWDETRQVVSDYHDPGRFVTFLSVECDPGPSGHKIILYKDTDVPPILAEQRTAVRSDPYRKRVLDPNTVRSSTVAELWQQLHSLGEKRVMVTAHHTADWKYHDPVLQRLAEVYSKWGTCEYPGNPLDLRPANPPREYVQEALGRGYQLGIIAGGDTHDSRPGTRAPEPFGLEFPDGLTAVFAESLTRDAIWEALWQRRTYGTTGARILLQFSVCGVPMGGETIYQAEPEISVSVHGTAPIASVELIRNNQVVHRWQDVGEQFATDYQDRGLLKDEHNYYYVRVTQEDRQMAWSSPVWLRQEQG